MPCVRITGDVNGDGTADAVFLIEHGLEDMGSFHMEKLVEPDDSGFVAVL